MYYGAKWGMKIFAVLCLSLILIVGPTLKVEARAPIARIKDIADIEGVRTNILIGYGLVVGLAGTGDAANSIPFTRQTLTNMLGKLGVNSAGVASQIKTKNVAAVMVTAEMPAYSRQGGRLDVTVSSLGDAKSLEGGMLLATSLIGADGSTYAVAQGPIVLGGYDAVDPQQASKEHKTVGKITSGAIVEAETGHELANNDNLRLVLKNPDFTTAMRVEQAINDAFGQPVSHAKDNATIDVVVPENLREEMVAIIQKVENVYVQPDSSARVIVDEKTGTIVMGEGVQISDVAISHANLNVRITELVEVMRQNEFGDPVEGDMLQTQVTEDESYGKFHMLERSISLADLVDGLNALGVKPRDIVSILQSIKAAGAMQAELVVM